MEKEKSRKDRWSDGEVARSEEITGEKNLRKMRGRETEMKNNEESKKSPVILKRKKKITML